MIGADTDYPGALWVPAHSSNYHHVDEGRANPTLIVIHCTDGGKLAQNTADMFATPQWKRQPPVASSAHFVVGQDGAVIQCVRVRDIAYHAHAANSYSVGVEHCARTPRELGPDDLGLPPSEPLYAASARLMAWLCRSYGIQPTRVSIVGHAEADATTTHTQCPDGCGWDWERYIGMVQAEFSAAATAA
jgi:N-acetyl-anhydromuramyl-L-alanine amidase AmpD